MRRLSKALFALNLAWLDAQGWSSDFALIVITGDIDFCALFVAYLVQLRRPGLGAV